MINNTTIYQVDAFTDEPFKGNPAGVMITDNPLTPDQMQNIALEMNLSETAFITPNETGFNIRYFTPTNEVPLCGHATLAGSHIIYELGLKKKHETIEFTAEDNDLTIKKDNDWIVMDFPKYPVQKINTPKDFKRSLGFEPVETYSSIYDWVIAVAENEAEISSSRPDFEFMKKNGLGHIMITSKSESHQADFVVRCFAPSLGINEDPVTGSAHCALTPLWSEKLEKTELDSVQLSKRTGKLKVRLNNGRVEIKGKALTIFEAKMKF
ncbi:PhzF family phenazine biosynthesis protein [Sinomicrobium weinanense]|uniref:PhzF family phenazine biosynthesis protein n=1 Tax=Sinomicrobium weinanense TaxID=2842200 RepID=A0A926PZV5_9FLAO|nr:PhzF family phenazine biosynthesis protein [Sinomicrobium weinanense]MBC9794363.1 PhzF family phenazine biosynthesis protein [Sinomicrobium weinanense]MBU3124270.1 PhzF family phenazine biosynthesis protein [Sinomicrobium weinanense]